MKGERGSVFPILAIVLVGGVLATLIAVELGRLASERRTIAFVADMAAEAGASMVDEAAMRAGELALDPAGAHDRAFAYAGEVGPPGALVTVVSGPAEVCVEISMPYEPRLLALVGASSVELIASACASPATG
jgi:hypothetical protein